MLSLVSPWSVTLRTPAMQRSWSKISGNFLFVISDQRCRQQGEALPWSDCCQRNCDSSAFLTASYNPKARSCAKRRCRRKCTGTTCSRVGRAVQPKWLAMQAPFGFRRNTGNPLMCWRGRWHSQILVPDASSSKQWRREQKFPDVWVDSESCSRKFGWSPSCHVWLSPPVALLQVSSQPEEALCQLHAGLPCLYPVLLTKRIRYQRGCWGIWEQPGEMAAAIPACAQLGCTSPALLFQASSAQCRWQLAPWDGCVVKAEQKSSKNPLQPAEPPADRKVCLIIYKARPDEKLWHSSCAGSIRDMQPPPRVGANTWLTLACCLGELQSPGKQGKDKEGDPWSIINCHPWCFTAMWLHCSKAASFSLLVQAFSNSVHQILFPASISAMAVFSPDWVPNAVINTNIFQPSDRIHYESHMNTNCLPVYYFWMLYTGCAELTSLFGTSQMKQAHCQLCLCTSFASR